MASKEIKQILENAALNVYEQRFEMLMKLIRIDRMLRSAKIVHKDKDKNYLN
jgi:hypothetical protein